MIGEAELVAVAAMATRTDAADVLDRCDVAGLARVCAAAEEAERFGTFEAAARILLAVLRERPFPDGANTAAAWLAAAVVLDAARVRIRARTEDVIAFVQGLDDRSPLLETIVGLERLASVSARRPAWRCPACHRELYAEERRTGRAVFVGVTAFELTNRCWFEHGAHDRRGEPLVAAR